MNIKFKQGQAVIATSSRNGIKTPGRFWSRSTAEGTGEWIEVNTAEKGKPAEIKRYRPKQVSPA
ncbi:hypothetical protein [Acidovorax phage ACPWH]|nr:hypothetical protein [Acidovorax phage ACPWH]QXV72227.1 hypothetical protein Acf1_00030 [Acidovorax phage ACF1]